jgi:hypothetical protein
MEFGNGAALGSAAADFLKEHLVKLTVRNGFVLEPGLTEAELAAVEGFGVLAEQLPLCECAVLGRAARESCDLPQRICR